MAAAAVSSGGVLLLYPCPWFRYLRRTARSLSVIAASSRIHHAEELSSTAEAPEPPTTTLTDKNAASYYPKRGQMVELVCESLAYKGKGLCKVDGTGFIVMCDRALPGEKFIGRVTRKKDNYAEEICLTISRFTSSYFFMLGMKNEAPEQPALLHSPYFLLVIIKLHASLAVRYLLESQTGSPTDDGHRHDEL